MLASSSINDNLDPNEHFFQTKEIIKILYNHLHTEPIKYRIMNMNPFNYRYNNNNDLYIHVRLTDAAHFNPGIKYYLNAINNACNFDKHLDKTYQMCIYISTDDVNHPMIHTLISILKQERNFDSQLMICDEITTFQFASTCRNIILSHGSFSAIIGYLGYCSTIYYPEYDETKIWYGDMFSIEGWNKVAHKS